MNNKPLGDPMEHYWRMIRMADAIGVAPVEAWKAGRLTSETHAAMVERCRGCAAPGACSKLLEGRPELSKAPDYCENKTALAEMKVEAAG